MSVRIFGSGRSAATLSSRGNHPLHSVENGGIEVGDYGHTGWQSFSYSLSADGTYTVGFRVVNMQDTALALFTPINRQTSVIEAAAGSAQHLLRDFR
jgi:hypothetical protein